MSNIRLNSIIRAFESGKAAHAAFSKLDKQTAIEMSDSPYDGIVFEMEHNPYDVTALGDALQYMLSRKQIVESASIAPKVTPIARIPANGVEMNQSFAKQVLDRGAYGVIWPHVATVEQAYNAVASCRYARPKNAPLYEPKGVRGDGPANAARYWGLSMADYYKKADVWPLVPEGEILVGLMCESTQAIENLDDILANVPGIGYDPDRRRRLEPGTGLPASVRASRGASMRCARSSRPARSTTWSVGQSARYGEEPSTPERRGLPLPDVGAAADLRRGRSRSRYGRLLMNGAESLVATLVDQGVDICFANPGTSEMHFLAALGKTQECAACCACSKAWPRAPPTAGTG